MERDKIDEQVRVGAARGAAAVTQDRQVIADAVLYAIDRKVDAELEGRAVENWSAWAFRVGANAAKVIAARRARDRYLSEASERERSVARSALSDEERAHLRDLLAAFRGLLVGRQGEVLEKALVAGMSLRRASQELGMDRRSMRRSFYSGLSRLRATWPNFRG